MTRDYGGGGKKGIGLPVIVVGAIVLVVAFLVGQWVWRRPGDIRKAEQWAITGPPCPRVTAQAFAAQPEQIRERFETDDITFGRNHGHVSCDEIVNDGGRGFGTFTECQFTGPGAVQVTTKAGDAYFVTGIGPATVAVRTDGISCVLAGKFKGEQSVVGE